MRGNNRGEGGVIDGDMKWLDDFVAWRRRVRRAQHDGRRLVLGPVEECDEVRCLNCGEVYRGRYCPSCGQQADIRRFKTRRLLGSLFVLAVGGDNMFFGTCLNLLYRPGHMVRDYLCGVRARYFQPVRMLLCMVAVYALALFLITSDYEMFGIAEQVQLTEGVHSESLQRAMGFVSGILSNNVVYALLSTLVYVLPYKLMFRRYKIRRPDGVERSLNTAEHFYTMVYVSCQSMLISFALLPFCRMEGIEAVALYASLISSVVLPAWCYRQMYGLGWLRCLARSAVAWLLTIMALVVLLILVFGFFYGYDAVRMG